MHIHSRIRKACFRWAAALLITTALGACTTPIVGPQVRPISADLGARLNGPWSAVLGEDRPLKFMGEYRDNASTHSYAMMYPAADLASFVAVIATHAAIQGAQTDARAAALQDQANSILRPYQDILGELRVHDLFRESLIAHAPQARLVAAPDATAARPQIGLAAQVTMTQDQRALVLDLVATANDRATTDAQDAYIHKIRVVSDPVSSAHTDVQSYWRADNGKALRASVKQILGQVIDLFVADATATLPHQDTVQMTARYQLGGELATERANLLIDTCERKTLRTLRGWVLSTPTAAPHQHQGACMKDSETPNAVARTGR